MKTEIEIAAQGADELGECPIWDERTGRLWWVDSRAPTVKSLDPATGAVIVLPLLETIGSIAFRERGGRLVRYSPAGKIDRVVELPVTNPTCCCFGGNGFDILYVTTARQRLSAAELAAQPLAGSLLAIRTGAQGLPESRFAG